MFLRRLSPMHAASHHLHGLRTCPAQRSFAVSTPNAAPAKTPVAKSGPKAKGGFKAELELLKYRRVTEDLLAEHLKFHVRGVSFNQEAASAVEPLQPLLFMREPGNPHDPNAVSVQTLSGQTVGYVPKEEAAENFVGHDKRGKPYGIMAGHVVSTGKEETSGNTGVTVAVYPRLGSLLLDPLPGDTSPVIDTEAAKQLEADVQACEVTGVPASELSQPLEVVPVWQYDVHNRTVQQLRAAVVCQDVAKAKGLLQLKPESKEYTRAAKLICDVNRWSPEHLQQHIEWVKARKEAMEAEGWQVKV